MGRVHGRHWKRIPGVTVTAFDASEQQLNSYASDLEVDTVNEFDSLLEATDIIDICLPTHLHKEFAMRSLAAGKPTLCEKPLCRTTAECIELAEYAAKLGVPLMPAQVVRCFPEFRRAHELVASGAIGEPAAIRTRRGGGMPKGTGWFGNHELSGGVIIDLMIHDFDWIRWTFGEVKQVFAQSLTFSGIESMDYGLATLTLDSGAIAHCEGTWADPGGFRVTFEICGSAGMIEHDSRNAQTLVTSTTSGQFKESPLAPGDDPYYRQLKGFHDAVTTGTPLPVTALDGVMAVSIGEAALESAKVGKPMAPIRP
jgi:predicted dehydrogenase